MCSPAFGIAGMAASGRPLRPLTLFSPAAAMATGGLFKKKHEHRFGSGYDPTAGAMSAAAGGV